MGKTQQQKNSAAGIVPFVILAFICGFAGCTAQSISATQQVLDFGDIAAGGSSSPQKITLVNNGNAATVAAISIQAMSGSPDGQFTITGGNCKSLTLQTSDTCTVEVQANPTVAGSVEAFLTVTATNLGDGVFTSQPVILKANGLMITLATNPALDFGNVVLGTTSPPQTFVLVNLATVPAVITGAGFFIQPEVGASTPQFQIANGSCITTGTLAANGGQCKFIVTAVPTVAGVSKQQFVFQGPPGAPYSTVTNSLTVNGVSNTNTLPPAPLPSPPSPAHKHKPSPSPPLPLPPSPAHKHKPAPSPPSPPSPRHHHHYHHPPPAHHHHIGK